MKPRCRRRIVGRAELQAAEWMTATRYRPPVTISREDFLIEGSDADFRRSIYAMIQSVGRLLACRDAFGRELDLTPSQFAVLMGVAHCQQREGVIIKDLADHVGLAATHVTTEVGRLERAGYLIKKPSPADRRSVCVFLTSHAKNEISSGHALHPSHQRRVVQGYRSGLDQHRPPRRPAAHPQLREGRRGDPPPQPRECGRNPGVFGNLGGRHQPCSQTSRSGGNSIGWSE